MYTYTRVQVYDGIVYTFAILHASVHKYGGKTQFSATNRKLSEAVNSTIWNLFATVCKIKRMNFIKGF